MVPVLAIALLFAANATAEATTTDTTEIPAAKPVKKPKAKKVCKNDTRATGTRISKQICKTEEEWAAKEDGQEIGLKSQASRADMENVGGMNQP